MKKTIITSIICLFAVFSKAQETKFDAAAKLQQEIQTLLYACKDRILTDSAFVYAFNITIDIKKNGKKTEVIAIKMNDSLGYALFANYKNFATFDYSNLQKDKQHARLFIPVIVYNEPIQPLAYFAQKGNYRLPIQNALNASHAIVYTGKYDNLREAGVKFEFRTNPRRNRGQEYHPDPFQEVVLMNPIPIDVTRYERRLFQDEG